jgi:hypothetical protein
MPRVRRLPEEYVVRNFKVVKTRGLQSPHQLDNGLISSDSVVNINYLGWLKAEGCTTSLQNKMRGKSDLLPGTVSL